MERDCSDCNHGYQGHPFFAGGFEKTTTWFYSLLHLASHEPLLWQLMFSALIVDFFTVLVFHSTSSDCFFFCGDTSTQLRTTVLSYGEVLDNLPVPEKAQTESDEA